jgi:hypothetical protein
VWDFFDAFGASDRDRLAEAPMSEEDEAASLVQLIRDRRS